MKQHTKKPQRSDLLLELKGSLLEEDILVTALAGTTYECYQCVDRPGNLYAVGMGMVSPVALGLAVALPKRRIIALDTDGGILLSPSILSVIGVYKPPNLRVIVFDNERLFGSRGGPPSQTAYEADLERMAQAAGITRTATLNERNGLQSWISWFLSEEGPAFLVAKVEPTIIKGSGPPIYGPENKFRLVRLIEEKEKIEILKPAR